MNKKQTGTGGEDIAVRFLEKKGYKILERNYTSKLGEIDIVAADGATTVFVEVKMRADNKFGLPRESVTPYKQRKYSMLAVEYLKQHRKMNEPARFDVIDILNGIVTHIINAFDYIGY